MVLVVMGPHQLLSCQSCSSRVLGIFCQMAEPLLGELDRAKTTNRYQKKQIIFYEGNEPYGIYCINSGVVKLYKTGLEGREQIVRMAKGGDVLGYRALFAGEAYTATAEVMEDAEICFVDKNAFFPLLERDPQVMLKVVQKLSRELRAAEDRIVGMVQKSARERMAELLLLLNQGYGKKDPQGSLLALRLTREDIADLVGTTQETAIRLLSEFNREKVILLRGRDIVLKDSSSLADIAGLSS